MLTREFRHFLVNRTADGSVRHAIAQTSLDAQPSGEVIVRVGWSSLNYKDALACQGHPGVAGPLPHVPGIDAAGMVAASDDDRYRVGEAVLVTGYELGAPRWGGWSEYIRVPADWVVKMPTGFSARHAMIVGTAGFTAAQCLRSLLLAEVTPDMGPVLVTGATGGVGSFAVQLLATHGFEVHAVTGKPHLDSALRKLGASEVLPRTVVEDQPKKPMLPARWAGGVDTVGGSPLTALLKSTRVGGCVAACGLVAGDQLPMTMYPFILRGVTLSGVTSASCSRRIRELIWDKLSTDWRVEYPDDWVQEVELDELPDAVEQIRRGDLAGRVVVKIGGDASSD